MSYSRRKYVKKAGSWLYAMSYCITGSYHLPWGRHPWDASWSSSFVIILHRVGRCEHRVSFSGPPEYDIVQYSVHGILVKSLDEPLIQSSSFDTGIFAILVDYGAHRYVVHLAPAADNTASTMLNIR